MWGIIVKTLMRTMPRHSDVHKSSLRMSDESSAHELRRCLGVVMASISAVQGERKYEAKADRPSLEMVKGVSASVYHQLIYSAQP